ncbi:MAG: MOSC domain-containing protein [Candidatus Omnitrophota bacterium]
MGTQGRIFSINISQAKGMAKSMARSGRLLEGLGLEGDAHAGPGIRQVSLLAIEQIEDFESRVKQAGCDLRPGSFGENITTEGLDLSRIRVGDRIRAGESAVLRVTQLGKTCHGGCSIRRVTGDCIMPQSGIFAVVEESGEIRVQEPLKVASQRKALWSWLKT